jgi:predicted DNA-binding transcriptional regulator AlpA
MTAETKRALVSAEPLWSHEETAAFLGISPATLHTMNYKKTGPRSFRVGKYRRYAARDVHGWLNEHASDRGAAA